MVDITKKGVERHFIPGVSSVQLQKRRDSVARSDEVLTISLPSTLPLERAARAVGQAGVECRNMSISITFWIKHRALVRL
jgi:hypothetical protein